MRADDARLASLLRKAGVDVGCELIAIGNAADHVHVVARVAPTIALSDFVQRLKGRSSIGDVDALSTYVARQREHHDDSHPAEAWIMRDREPAEGGL